jgi:hypothetical protein
MSEQDGKTIVFGGKELDPNEEARYVESIRNARAGGGVGALKGSEPVGVVPRPSIPLAEKALRAEEAAASSRTPEGGVRARPPGSPLISPDTAAMLQEASAVAAAQAHAEAAAPKEEAPKATEDLFAALDFQGRNEAERILNNKKRRIAIESRCEPMSIDDLILRDEVRQLVPIIPGKFEVLFRSMTPEENLFIKQIIAKFDQDKSDQYVMEKFAICQLTCCVMAINGRTFPDHRKPDGTPDDDLFNAKLKQLVKKSGYVIADLDLNYAWFDIRVRKLLNPDDLGNG